MESLKYCTSMGPHHLLRFKKEKVHMENLNLGYQDGLKDLKHIRKLNSFFDSTLCTICCNSTELYYHSTFSSVIQKHFAMVILSVNRFHLVYCKIHVSEIQHRNYTIQNVMHNPFLHILISTFDLKHHQLFLKSII